MKAKFNTKGFVNSLFFSLIGIVAVLILWTLGVNYTTVGLLLPTPMEVLERAIYTMSNPIGRTNTLLMHLAVSLRRVLVGFTLSALCGVILGIAMGRFKMVEAIFKPLFQLHLRSSLQDDGAGENIQGGGECAVHRYRP